MILNIDSSEFIKKVTDYIKNEKAGFCNDLSASEKKEIKRGIEELEKGQRKTQANLKNN
jgi:hypothetical protein